MSPVRFWVRPHKKQRTFLCFTLFFMILRRNHVSQVPPKRRISVLIYAKMPPFFHAERTHGWIKKKSDSATCRIAEDLPDAKHLLLFFPVWRKTVTECLERNFLRQSSDNRHVDDFRSLVCAVCFTPSRIRTTLHRRSARSGIFSSYVTVFRRFLSGANLSLVDARITAVLSFWKEPE